jgi:hypothetical protein
VRHAKLSLARRGPSTHEATRVHYSSRRRGGMAARGARAPFHLLWGKFAVKPPPARERFDLAADNLPVASYSFIM